MLNWVYIFVSNISICLKIPLTIKIFIGIQSLNKSFSYEMIKRFF